MLWTLIRRSIIKDFNSNSLRVLLLALIVAVAAVTAVGFFTDRIERAMRQQATDLLAADLLVTSHAPINAQVRELAEQAGLQIAEIVTFPSVVLNDDDDSKLVSVKAVSDNYPLRGKFTVKHFDESITEANAPTPGSLYIAPVLRGLLSLEQGSALLLGRDELAVAAIVDMEPDQGGELFQMAPRVMMNTADLASSGLLIEGSRARYSLLFAGNLENITSFRQSYEVIDQTGLSLRDADNASPQIKRVLDQISRFFGLSAMLTVLLSGAAIAMAVRQYAHDQARAGAVLRTLGASRKTVLYWMLIRLILVAIVGLVLGLCVGLVSQTLFTTILGSWFQVELPPAGIRPVFNAIGVTALTLLGFASLPLMRAGAVPVLSVLRHELGELSVSSRLTAVVAIVAGIAMMYMQSGDIKLVMLLLLGLVAILGVFAIAGGVIYRLMRKIVPRRFAMARFVLRRRMDVTLLQLSTFGLTIMAILLISVVRQDILQEWQKSIPDSAPNRFIVNVQPDQVDAVEAELKSHTGGEVPLYPVSRGRLTAVNSELVADRYAGNKDAMGFLNHDFNLSYNTELPQHNIVSSGEWWGEDEDCFCLSAESGFLKRLNLKLGDDITFDVGGIAQTAKIVNVREVEWESFQVNFFVITTPAVLESLPRTFITSFRQASEDHTLVSSLVKSNPGITIIDVGSMLARVRGIIERGALAVQSVFLFTLLAGIIVLLSAVQSSQAVRTRELAVFRSMGASHSQVRQSVILEFALLGGTAGFLAAFFANIIAWAIGREVLNVVIGLNLWLWLFGTLGGALVVGLAGYTASRKVMYTPPLMALRAIGR